MSGIEAIEAFMAHAEPELGLSADQRMQAHFDRDGQPVAWADVYAASPKGSLNGVEFCEPVPGRGFYAGVRLASMGVNSDGLTERLYEIAGPGWSASVREVAREGGQTKTWEITHEGLPAEAIDFLEQFK